METNIVEEVRISESTGHNFVLPVWASVVGLAVVLIVFFLLWRLFGGGKDSDSN
jgi:type VI protein secretion system component VasF